MKTPNRLDLLFVICRLKQVRKSNSVLFLYGNHIYNSYHLDFLSAKMDSWKWCLTLLQSVLLLFYDRWTAVDSRNIKRNNISFKSTSSDFPETVWWCLIIALLFFLKQQVRMHSTAWSSDFRSVECVGCLSHSYFSRIFLASWLFQWQHFFLQLHCCVFCPNTGFRWVTVLKMFHFSSQCRE